MIVKEDLLIVGSVCAAGADADADADADAGFGVGVEVHDGTDIDAEGPEIGGGLKTTQARAQGVGMMSVMDVIVTCFALLLLRNADGGEGRRTMRRMRQG